MDSMELRIYSPIYIRCRQSIGVAEFYTHEKRLSYVILTSQGAGSIHGRETAWERKFTINVLLNNQNVVICL